ncbi:hypothetical protein AMJ39_03020 [candidate division TA06 bacterium DG_24]|uniref:QueT transporter n=3 Tax=Bacteria division TA06 TaxID=1156500 RepID=A0A0S8JJI6_UNCT6|nr:MAG: hypothetical protein AMJ39_03020 [candidate division TA06 bacterium DG_24]KPK67560.1 MAG: hypothetical protein AMJ82_10380 [candidate division TA06 bacterium SM23_40]KPL09832.1 MAG: hypothetical protein AMJ71_05450 [candidate division TA06 bacterium SM1_40]
MREVWTLWENTRMVVLVALSAALYAALLIPFKVVVPIIPGFTELRPGNAIPIICSLAFGPAAAWGSAFGNLIGDFFGTLGPGSIPGFLGNFLYGYVPYKVWGRMGLLSSGKSPGVGSPRRLVEFLLAALLASMVCGVVIGWGLDTLRLVPFAALGNIIFLNNFIVSAILGPILMGLIYPRLERWGITWGKILGPRAATPSRFSWLGVSLLWLGAVSGLVLGNMISMGLYETGFLARGFGTGAVGEMGIAVGLLPSIVIILLGAALL